MTSSEDSTDFNEARADIFEAISHPARIKILQTLNEKPMGFAELGRAVGIEGGGHLSFHLRKLSHLVKTTPEGTYALTGDGKEALWSINALRKSSSGTSTNAQVQVKHRTWARTVLGVAALSFAMLILIGGFVTYVPAASNQTNGVGQTHYPQGVGRAFEFGIHVLQPGAWLNTSFPLTAGSSVQFDWSSSHPLDVFVFNSSQFAEVKSNLTSQTFYPVCCSLNVPVAITSVFFAGNTSLGFHVWSNDVYHIVLYNPPSMGGYVGYGPLWVDGGAYVNEANIRTYGSTCSYPFWYWLFGSRTCS